MKQDNRRARKQGDPELVRSGNKAVRSGKAKADDTLDDRDLDKVSGGNVDSDIINWQYRQSQGGS